MNKRPLAVTIIAVVYFATGVLGLGFHLNQWRLRSSPPDTGIALIVVVELIAVVAGIYMLRGKNWARWLAILWMAGHVAVSVPNLQQTVIHTLILLAFAYFLFRRRSMQYFHPATE